MTDLSAPRIHELAVAPDADRACFHVYELWPDNAVATLQALRDFDDQGGRIAALILSHSPGCIPPAGLPASVPWLLVRTTVQADLEALRRILVDPLVEPGTIGVDFADHAAALARGGRIDLWHSEVSSASAAAFQIADQVSGWSPAGRAGAAVIVHVRAARHLAMKAINHLGAVIEQRLTDADGDVLVVPSVSFHEYEHIEVRLLTVGASMMGSVVMPPPRDLDAERAVLSSMMRHPELFPVVQDMLVPGDFHADGHQLVFEAILELERSHLPWDVVTIGDWLASRDLLDQVDRGLLLELASGGADPSGIAAWAGIVRDKSILRALIKTCVEMRDSCLAPGSRSAASVATTAVRDISGIHLARVPQGPGAVASSMEEALRLLQSRCEEPGDVHGIPTGFPALDGILNGLQPANLIVLGGLPVTGKSALVLNVAEYVAVKLRKAVAVFSMEMSASQLGLRLISAVGQVEPQRLCSGRLDVADWNRVAHARETLTDAPIFIDDSFLQTPEQIHRRCIGLRRAGGLDFVVIDSLQRVETQDENGRRFADIAHVSRSLKKLARELDIPILVTSQLNRPLEARSDKHPLMADLRGSDGIEDDADVVLLLYRDDYYNCFSSPEPEPELAEVIVCKNRNGPIGTVKLRFYPERSRFVSCI